MIIHHVMKPATRYMPPDWHRRNQNLVQTAENQRDVSHGIREEARQLRNETHNRTKWDYYYNTERLSDRVTAIDLWRESLQHTLEKLTEEICTLTEAKEAAERALESKAMPLEVARECITTRERRLKFDLVKDDVEIELKKEVELIESCKAQLLQKAQEAWEQLQRLQEAYNCVVLDLTDKAEASVIDINQKALTEASPNISYKTDPLRIPKGTVAIETWEEHSRQNKAFAEAEMEASLRLREANFATIKLTNNDMAAQQDSTNFQLRKRIHEIERAADELQWQKKNTLEEIGQLEGDIEALEVALYAKTGPLKVAETRLEARTARPHMELCRDHAQDGLIDEVKQLRLTRQDLRQKADEAKETLNSLQRHLARLNEELKYKNKALMLDQQCADIRKKLTSRNPNVTRFAAERNLPQNGTIQNKTQLLA